MYLRCFKQFTFEPECSSTMCVRRAAAVCRGRVRLQVMGFMWVFVIFLVCAIAYNDLIKKQYIAVFQVRSAGLLEVGVLPSTCFVFSVVTMCALNECLPGKHS